MTKNTIILIVLTLTIAGLSFLLIRKTINVPQFLVLCGVWIFLTALIISNGNAELWFSLFALLISILTFILQNTPLIVLNDLAVVESGQKLYLYFQNKGAIPAYRIEGYFALTVCEIDGKSTSDEKILADGPISADGEAFYPSTSENDVNFISKELGLKKPFESIQGHRYFSIKIKYPRFPFWNVYLPEIPYLWKGYEGVFVFAPEDGKWKRSSKTHLPEFFKKIFTALNDDKRPPYPSY